MSWFAQHAIFVLLIAVCLFWGVIVPALSLCQ